MSRMREMVRPAMKDEGSMLGVFIDLQGRLHEQMPQRPALDKQVDVLARGLSILDIPRVVSEQMPEKLGVTYEPLRTQLAEEICIRKSTFSCCGAAAFQDVLNQYDPRRIILAGIEAHICVYQTALDLLAEGREVWVAADATASRISEHRDYACERLRAKGVGVMPVESILLQVLGDAADERFKKVLPLLKGY